MLCIFYTWFIYSGIILLIVIFGVMVVFSYLNPGEVEVNLAFVTVTTSISIAFTVTLAIGWLLGVPKEDWPMLFDWTNAIIGAGDPELVKQIQRLGERSTAASRRVFA